MELLLWQVLVWVVYFIFKLIHFFELGHQVAHYILFFLFYLLLFFDGLLTDLCLLMLEPLEQFCCLVLIYVKHWNPGGCMHFLSDSVQL